MFVEVVWAGGINACVFPYEVMNICKQAQPIPANWSRRRGRGRRCRVEQSNNGPIHDDNRRRSMQSPMGKNKKVRTGRKKRRDKAEKSMRGATSQERTAARGRA